MDSFQSAKDTIDFQRKRIRYLEEVNRMTIDAIEMAASLGDFQASINQLHEPSVILRETRSRIQRLLNLDAAAFFLVDEKEHDFKLADCEPEKDGPMLKKEMHHAVDTGIFAWTLRERRPVIVSASGSEDRILLHAMATTSRVRGMFMGVIGADKDALPDVSLSLLSVILLNSSNALESFELYKMVREISASLEQKENYRTLFEAAPDGVEVLDARGNIIDCNKTQQMLMGCERRELVGRHTTDFFSQADGERFRQKFETMKSSGYAEGEIEMVCSDGTAISVWRKEKAIYNKNGKCIGSVVYNRDVSELKRTQREKQELQAKLQRSEKMQAIGTLAGGVAHDLNNVLAGLVSYPEMLLRKMKAGDPLRRSIKIIQKSGQKAALMVDDLLTMARRGVSVTEVVNLNHVVGEYLMSAECSNLKQNHPDIEMKVALKPDLLNIMGSPVHLSKTVMNLVANAAEAMSSGGTITVETCNRYIDRPIKGYDEVVPGDYATLTISDDGIGIEPADLARIFEPFYTKKVMGRSGTGLGMAVVWGAVKDHNGYIDIISQPGAGTKFTLYFPVTRQKAALIDPPAAIEAYQGRGESILIVDDVAEQREVATGILEQLGYRATSVPSGEAAISYLQSQSTDLVVLDMIMDPGIDGLETYRQIIAHHPGQRAIITSGSTDSDRVARACRLGAGPYIKKPYLIESLGLAVRTELDRAT